MEFILEFFVLITGIGAASGLSYDSGNLLIVSDNSNYVYEYHIESKILNRHLLLDMNGRNEQVNKKQKLDLEAIAQDEDVYHLFPSGSESNRTTRFAIDPADCSSINKTSLNDLYRRLRQRFRISEEDFNIEGAVFHQDTLLLFNRGNGPNEMNGIFKVFEKQGDLSPTFTPIKLPHIHGETAGFTDATIVAGKIFFLAAAEGGKSSYHDGDIGGSQVGTIDLSDLTLGKVEVISTAVKFEGITLYRECPSDYIFLLCEDPDDDGNKSVIHQLRIEK